MRPLLPVATALAMALMLSTTSTATASGSYTVTACSPTNSPGAWTQVNTSSSGLTSGNQCGGPAIGPIGVTEAGALFGEDIVGSTTQVPAGAAAGWQFAAPAGTTITTVTYYRGLATAVGSGSWEAGLFAANGAPLDICVTDPDPCSSPNNQAPITVTGLDTNGLFFGVECGASSPQVCIPGSTQHDAQADMYSVKVTLADTAMPTVAGEGGPLWTASVVAGTVTISFSASDVTGIQQVAVDGAGGQLALTPESCDFTETQPCPQLPSGSIPVNTAQLRDGPETVSLLVTDAAGNTQSVTSPTFVVDNNGPPAPSALSAAPIAGNTKAIQLTWSDPPDPPQPVSGAQVQVCQAACGPPNAVSPAGSAIVAVAGPGTYGVRLWLTDSAGRGGPSNAATASVTVPSVGSTGRTGPSGGSGGKTPTLRLSHTLKRRRLTVNVTVPKGISGPITVVLSALRGKHHVGLLRRRVKVVKGHAILRVTLTTTETHATQLDITATATRARAASIVLHHLR